MKSLQDLETPCLVVDLDKLQNNLAEMQSIANTHGVELWPMIKTHKSTYILKEQLKLGAKGMLAAKLGEAEKLVEAGAERVMLAYPIIGEQKLNRLVKLSKKVEIFCSIDNLEAAKQLNQQGIKEGIQFQCIIIVDTGLRRLGVLPEAVGDFYQKLKSLEALKIVGVATHGGHVYGAVNGEAVQEAANQEIHGILEAAKQLEALGVSCEIIALGSTPTVKALKDFEGVKQIRPGNYVFYDSVQVALGVVPVERCALKVLATVISIPEPGRAIIDAGSKILCLDMGAHGNNLINGYGMVMGIEGAVIKSLSEELGKLFYDPETTTLAVGQQIEIIPNHACTATNMVNRLYGIRNNQVEEIIEVTARGISQ